MTTLTSPRSAELLDRIAAALGVPIATFTAPAKPASTDIAPAAHIAALVFDADGRRLAAAFAHLPPPARRSLANVAEALLQDAPPADADPAHARQRR